ncbi:thiol:disulfide interchange protein DsbD [Rhizobium sp. BIGb0125]|uniref:protein-disulfide reductase DsbD n=1 Tax=Rhizobium sp. BIGb0125 TaxID=2940618 RepID=UPI0021683E5E|nr:protein-disulfide reductase DsbD [Rhizobium sp. BIGb0125]MCS4242483.1 thiol:disulfide interchange protein DsbD [Rhizobium sp. BIGb0125]
MRILAFTFAMLTLVGMTLAGLVTPAVAVQTPLEMDLAFKVSVEQAADNRAVIRWTINDGYYLYRDYLSAEDSAGNKLELQTLPGKVKDDPNFGSTEIYYATATASVLNAPQTFRLTYQGCQEDGLCYPPTTKVVDMATLSLDGDHAGKGLFSQGGFAAAAKASNAFSSATSTGNATVRPDDNGSFTLADEHAETAIDRMLSDGGLALLLAGFLGFGVLLAFTPCVFPMYPIVAAMLAREGENLTARRGFTLSSAYVLALACAFGLLGMVAAWSGQNLQVALQSTTTVAAIAILFVVLALSNFGLFHLQLPAFISARFSKGKTRAGTVPGAMALGFSSALLIGPCVTAPLAGALLYIARTGDIAIGAAALFALGLGKGIPLVIMATASGKALPKAGMWMEKVRQIFGFLFLATALWLATPLLPQPLVLLGWAVLALCFGVFAFTAASGTTGSGFSVISRSAGLASIIWAALLFVGLGLGASDPLAPLKPLLSGGGAQSVARIEKSDFAKVNSLADLQSRIASAPSNEPTLVYITADWCVTCRTIERALLTSPDVVDALGKVNLVSLDLTQLNDDKQAMLSALGVIGPPTMVFLNAKRREPAATRLVGEFSASDLAASARKAREDSL